MSKKKNLIEIKWNQTIWIEIKSDELKRKDLNTFKLIEMIKNYLKWIKIKWNEIKRNSKNWIHINWMKKIIHLNVLNWNEISYKDLICIERAEMNWKDLK